MRDRPVSRNAGLMEITTSMIRMISRLCLAFAVLMVFCSASFAGAGPTVLFDQGHGQKFVLDKNGPLDLSSFADVVRKSGCQLKVLDGPLTRASLSGVDALVISGAFHPLAPDELQVVASYLAQGGRLCVMLHIGMPVGALLQQLGVNYSNGVIHETENVILNDPLNFRVTRLERHPLTAGLQRFSAHGAWALMNKADTARIIARTSPTAWVDLNGDHKLSSVDAVQSFGVMVTGSYGKGQFVVFGDDAIFQNKFLESDNMLLARNLAEWLKGEPAPPVGVMTDTLAPGAGT
jgi:hypothetical protein